MSRGRLLWCDPFLKEGPLDSTKWKYDVGGHGWGNNELQYYTPQNAVVGKEGLVITAMRQSCEGKDYSSARVLSVECWSPPIIIEVRARVPTGKGIWPAIWMLPEKWNYGDWPKSGEIDIMEHVGFHENVIFGSVHTELFNHLKDTQISKRCTIDLAAAHTFRCEWSTTAIKLSVDDQLPYFVYEKKGDWQSWPFDQPFRLLLNIAVGGNWGGSRGVDDAIFPSRLCVESVKVFELISAEPVGAGETPSAIGSVIVTSPLGLVLCQGVSGVVASFPHLQPEHLWLLFRQGHRVFLQTMGSRQWLGSTAEGKVGLSDDRQGWHAEGGTLRSATGGLLTVLSDGQVGTIPCVEQKDQVEKSLCWNLAPQIPPAVPKGPVLIMSAAHRRFLNGSLETVCLSDAPDYWEFCEVRIRNKIFLYIFSCQKGNFSFAT